MAFKSKQPNGGVKILQQGGENLPFRDPKVIETIVGKRRRAVQIGTGFWDWPLWTAHPTWHQVQEQLAKESSDKSAATDPANTPSPDRRS